MWFSLCNPQLQSAYRGEIFWNGSENKYLIGIYILVQISYLGSHCLDGSYIKLLRVNWSSWWLTSHTTFYKGQTVPTVCSVVVVTMPVAMMPKHTSIMPIYWWEIQAPSALHCCNESFHSLGSPCVDSSLCCVTLCCLDFRIAGLGVVMKISH